MSGRRVPVLCRPATRKEVQEYVRRARSFAREEFERGHTEADVLRRLRRATPGIAMRYQVEEEYLRFLGIGPAAVTFSRLFSGALAVAVYLVVSRVVQSPLPVVAVGVPTLVAVAAGLGCQRVARWLWKRRKP